MKSRIRMIALKPIKTWTALAMVPFAALVLTALAQKDSNPASIAQAPKPGEPRIVSTVPAIGAKDVDPSISEITVTFDSDMAGGFSWTGAGPEFPPNPGQAKPVWRNKRTCALPVKLEPGHFYRVGINSSTHRNFRNAEGVPAEPVAFYFSTKGAAADLEANFVKPTIIAMNPANGATDVDPDLKELRVSFNVPMKNGFSWTGGGPEFPPAPEGKRPYWTDDGKTCVLPVALKAGSSYRVGLNSPSHKNFQSASGIPLEPAAYTFKTK